MKHKELILILTMTLLLCFVQISAAQSSPTKEIKISTSFPILTLITREFVEPSVAIKTLTASGDEAHHFEMSPKTLMELQKQDLLIVNGLGFEHWLSQLENNKKMKLKLVVASQGVKTLKGSPQKEVDPHAWLDPENLLIYSENIHRALLQNYPDRSKLWDEKAKLLKEKILTWKRQKEEAFAKIPRPFSIVTAHSAFNYFSAAFQFKTIALLGDHEGETLSPRQLTLQIKELQNQSRRAFFGDGSKQDQILQDWAKKTSSPWGGTLLGDSLGKAPADLNLMAYLEYNASTILKAFSITH